MRKTMINKKSAMEAAAEERGEMKKTSASEWLDRILAGGAQDDRFLEAVQTYDYYMDGELEGELVVYVDGSVMKLNDAEFETMESITEVEKWFEDLVKDGDISNYKLVDTTSTTADLDKTNRHLNRMFNLGEAEENG